jgi:RNA polymerase sigma-70 factor (ECF subfamily)
MAGEGRHGHDGPQADEVSAIVACLRGDRSAYELIVRRYAARASGVAKGLLRDASLADDAAQEAFVRAYRALRRFDLREPFYPWFFRILRNVCLTLRKRRAKVEASLDPASVRAPPADPAAGLSRRELRERIDAAMARLSDAHREILVLSHFDELSYKEIAACLAIPIGTVMSRLWAARRALREALGPMEAALE